MSVKRDHPVLFMENYINLKNESIRDLGVIVSPNLTWTSHVNSKIANCYQRLAILRRNVPNILTQKQKSNYTECTTCPLSLMLQVSGTQAEVIKKTPEEFASSALPTNSPIIPYYGNTNSNQFPSCSKCTAYFFLTS